jgi:putative glutathione S-transferase
MTMGLLVDGEWKDRWYDTDSTGGKFKREESVFRNWITADGSAGPSGESGFKAEPGRYHLSVSYACPWAHRTLIMRALKGLENSISVSVVHWHMGEHGWTFAQGSGVVPHETVDATYLYEVYLKAKSDYTGRVTVPVLWDKKKQTIVSNESAEIIRMFNSAFNEVGARKGDYYSQDLREDIDDYNERIYHTVNNGVYKAGFATSQDVYEREVAALFDSLDWLESELDGKQYLCGDQLTEADIRLFTTLIRFDAVYHGHFKCNIRRIADYPNIHAFTKRLYSMPEIKPTVHFEHIKRHYYGSHKQINPTGIIPLGPDLNLDN